MRGWVRLGLTAGSPQAFAARNEHWVIISIQLILFIAGGISTLALAIADYRRERDADSLLLLLWVVGTFWFTAYLNWTVNARSILPMVPAIGILLARRLREALPKSDAAIQSVIRCRIVGMWSCRRSGWPVPTPMLQTRREPQPFSSTKKRLGLPMSGSWDIRDFSITCKCSALVLMTGRIRKLSQAIFSRYRIRKSGPKTLHPNSVAHEKTLSCRCSGVREHNVVGDRRRLLSFLLVDIALRVRAGSGREVRNHPPQAMRFPIAFYREAAGECRFLDLARFPPT